MVALGYRELMRWHQIMRETEDVFTQPPIKWIGKECKMVKEMKKSYTYNVKVQNNTHNLSLYYFSILTKTGFMLSLNEQNYDLYFTHHLILNIFDCCIKFSTGHSSGAGGNLSAPSPLPHSPVATLWCCTYASVRPQQVLTQSLI